MFWTPGMVKQFMNQRNYKMEKQNRAQMDVCFNKFRNDEAGIKQK